MIELEVWWCLEAFGENEKAKTKAMARKGVAFGVAREAAVFGDFD